MKRVYGYTLRWGKFFPLAPLEVKTGKRGHQNVALLDSGATVSIFREEVAHTLGLKIEEGEPVLLGGVGGLIRAYVHRLTVAVAEQEFPCDIGFSRQYTARMNILGRKDFFEKFLIIFDEKNHEFFLETEEVAPIE